MRTGRPRATVTLTLDERQQLDALAHRSRSAPDLARRARIILACAEGRETTAVARRLHVSATTVCKWRARFLEERLDGLFDEPRPGAPRSISDEQIEQVVIRTLETTPRGATHWSVRDMAKASGISRSSVNRIWRAFGLQPHRSETFKLSNDPLLIDKIRDIVGLYMNPPDHAVVLWSTRRPKFKRWTGRNRCCRCAPARWNGARTITNGTAPRRCLRRSTSKPVA